MRTVELRTGLAEALRAASMTMTDEAVVRLLSSDDGAEINQTQRDEMLARCAAGQYVQLDVELMAYEQQTGVRNRNNVRLRDGAISDMARSFRKRPCMKDHDHGSMDAVWGTIQDSRAEKLAEGHYKVFQTVRLTDPGAVSKALRNLLSTVSVSWRAKNGMADVSCSACDKPIFTECYHYPGDRVMGVIGDDGKKRMVRNRQGDTVVEWVYNSGEGLETSFVSVPAVPSAGVDRIRASLATLLPAEFSEDDSPQPENKTMTEAEKLALEARIALLTKLCGLNDSQRDFYEKLGNVAQDAFLGMSVSQRDDEMKPVWTSADGIKFTKADDLRIIEMAKSQDRQMESLKKRIQQADEVVLRNRAESELAHLSGTIEARIAVLLAIESIPDEKIRAEALKSITEYDGKQARNFSRQGSQAKPNLKALPGGKSKTEAATSFKATSETAMERLDNLAAEYAAEKEISPELAMAKILDTDEGTKLYAEIDAERASGESPAH